MNELIGTAAVAEILGCARNTVTEKVKAGLIPVAGKMGPNTGAYLFNRSEIESLGKALSK